TETGSSPNRADLLLAPGADKRLPLPGTARHQRPVFKGSPSKARHQRSTVKGPWKTHGQMPVVKGLSSRAQRGICFCSSVTPPAASCRSRVPGPGSRVPSLGPRAPGFPSWEKSPTKRPRMNRGPVSVRHCLCASAHGAVDQLHVRHRRVVAVAEAALEDPQVAARARLVARAELDEQLAH